MDNKLFKDKLTLEEIEKVVNEYMEEELLSLKEKELLEKWNYFPIIFLEKKSVIKKFLETIEYIDELSLEKEIKIQYILTFCYLVLKEKLRIVKMDINNIYILIAYTNTLPIKSIKKSIDYLNNEQLLLSVRMKSLDLEIRINLLRYIDSLSKDIKEVITFLEEIDYYKLIEMIK